MVQPGNDSDDSSSSSQSLILQFEPSSRAIHSLSRSVVQSFSRSVVQSFGHSVIQSFSHSVTQPFSRPLTHSLTHSLPPFTPVRAVASFVPSFVPCLPWTVLLIHKSVQREKSRHSGRAFNDVSGIFDFFFGGEGATLFSSLGFSSSPPPSPFFFFSPLLPLLWSRRRTGRGGWASRGQFLGVGAIDGPWFWWRW